MVCLWSLQNHLSFNLKSQTEFCKKDANNVNILSNLFCVARLACGEQNASCNKIEIWKVSQCHWSFTHGSLHLTKPNVTVSKYFPSDFCTFLIMMPTSKSRSRLTTQKATGGRLHSAVVATTWWSLSWYVVGKTARGKIQGPLDPCKNSKIAVYPFIFAATMKPNWIQGVSKTAFVLFIQMGHNISRKFQIYSN